MALFLVIAAVGLAVFIGLAISTSHEIHRPESRPDAETIASTDHCTHTRKEHATWPR